MLLLHVLSRLCQTVGALGGSLVHVWPIFNLQVSPVLFPPAKGLCWAEAAELSILCCSSSVAHRGVCTSRCSSFQDCGGAQHNKLGFITVSVKLLKTRPCLEISPLECAEIFRSFCLALCKKRPKADEREREICGCVSWCITFPLIDFILIRKQPLINSSGKLS